MVSRYTTLAAVPAQQPLLCHVPAVHAYERKKPIVNNKVGVSCCSLQCFIAVAEPTQRVQHSVYGVHPGCGILLVDTQ
jgi:hypothetical protein